MYIIYIAVLASGGWQQQRWVAFGTWQAALQVQHMLMPACADVCMCLPLHLKSLMVPCADMANHVLSPNAGYRFVSEADAFQLQALQVRGAEVTHFCGGGAVGPTIAL